MNHIFSVPNINQFENRNARVYSDSNDTSVYSVDQIKSVQCRECGYYTKEHHIDYNHLCPRCSDVYDQ